MPYAQARKPLEEAEQRIRTLSKEREIVPLAGLLVPAIANARGYLARGQRELEMLRVVEAIRMYAATHDRKLPASLADIQAVPVPHDPVTGEPFRYAVDGKTAILESVDDREPVRYKLRIAEE